NNHLQNAWNKYGEAAFVFEIIERCEVGICLNREQHYLDTIKPWDHNIGYNICRFAGSPREKEVSAETRAKISAAHRGRKHTEQAVKNMKAAHWSKRPDAAEIAEKT